MGATRSNHLKEGRGGCVEKILSGNFEGKLIYHFRCVNQREIENPKKETDFGLPEKPLPSWP